MTQKSNLVMICVLGIYVRQISTDDTSEEIETQYKLTQKNT